MLHWLFWLGTIGCTAAAAAAQPAGQVGPGVLAFTVRPGYRVTLAADGLNNARFLALDNQGTLYVSQPASGSIVALREPDADGFYRRSTRFVIGKPTCQAVQFFQGALWFATSGGIYKARDIKNTGMADDVEAVIPEGQLPSSGRRPRSLLVTEAGFYTAIGDSGNITDETATDRQKIWFYSLDGKQRKLFASGIRNTEKLAFRPGTTELWGCDQGSDGFGQKFGEKPPRLKPITDLNPPDEFNRYVEGGFYGHPFLVGNRIPRPEYAERPDIVELAARTIPPAWDFGAHGAPEGWCFLTGDHFPGHKGDAVVAFHGSSDRGAGGAGADAAGYCVQRVLFDPVTQRPFGSQTLVRCLAGEKELERPVDCAEAPDGSILFSGDTGNRVYRIRWTGNAGNHD